MKTILKHLRRSGNFALKILVKTMKRWGIYSPNRKLAVRLICRTDRLAVDRPGRPPTVVIMTVGPSRPIDPADRQMQRAELSGPVVLPADRPNVCQTCTRLCTSVDRKRSTGPWCGRPCGRPTWPVSHYSGSETHV